MASPPYREFYHTRTNIPQDRRICGVFQLISTASQLVLDTFCRPSTSTASTAGQGNMFTVTQPDLTKPQYLVTCNESQLQPVSVDVTLLLQTTSPGTDGTPPAAYTYAAAQPVAVASQIDQGSHSFYVTLVGATTGTIAAATITPPAGFVWQISFEAVQKPTFAPASL